MFQRSLRADCSSVKTHTLSAPLSETTVKNNIREKKVGKKPAQTVVTSPPLVIEIR